MNHNHFWKQFTDIHSESRFKHNPVLGKVQISNFTQSNCIVLQMSKLIWDVSSQQLTIHFIIAIFMWLSCHRQKSTVEGSFLLEYF